MPGEVENKTHLELGNRKMYVFHTVNLDPERSFLSLKQPHCNFRQVSEMRLSQSGIQEITCEMFIYSLNFGSSQFAPSPQDYWVGRHYNKGRKS